MFSSGGGYQSQGAIEQYQQQLADDKLLGFLQQMNQQEQAAMIAQQKAQKEALIASQKSAADQTAMQSSLQAQQQQQIGNQIQQNKDQTALSAEQQKEQAAGAAATGGGVDINAIKTASLGNLGAAAGTLPNTQANASIQGVAPVNPALTSALSASNPSAIFNSVNKFNSPNMQGIKFGGG